MRYQVFIGDLSRDTQAYARSVKTGTLPIPDCCAVFPGFCNVHVHTCKPGFSV